jgi:hypothetical protein
VAAGIERNRVIAGPAKDFARAFPGVARLAAAMLENDQRPVRVSPHVRRQPTTTGTSDESVWIRGSR